MLDLHSEVAMTVDEMVVLNPWQRTIFDVLKKHDLKTTSGLKRGLEKIYNCEAYGAFWRYFDRGDIPIDDLLKEVENGEQTTWGVIDAFLNRCRSAVGKERVGAKNFAHFSYLPQVMERYPDAKCIFLVRDPLAMCASKLKSPGTRGRKKKNPALAPFIHFVILIFFIIEFKRTANAYEKYKRKYPIFRVRYEDLVKRPHIALQEVCEFCDLPYEEEMLSASGKESSHTGSSRKGVDPSRVSGGVESLKAWEKWLVASLTAGARDELGYCGKAAPEPKTNEDPGYLKGY